MVTAAEDLIAHRPKLGYWGQIVGGKVRYDLHEDQWIVLSNPARYKAAIAGTGGGKTAMGPVWCLEECQKVFKKRNVSEDPIAALVLAPTYRMLARATADEFVKVFSKSPFAGRYIESKGYYELPNQWGKVWLLSADRPDRIEGKQFDFAWLDEAGQMKYDAWANVQNRLGLRVGPALLTTTPYEINWLKRKFVDLADAGNKSYFYHSWWSIANPAYPLESYVAAQQSMSEARFKMRYQGLFSASIGMVYGNLLDRVAPFEVKDLPTPIRLRGGVDWGYSPDPFAAIVAAVTPPIVEGEPDHMWVFFERYVPEEISLYNARQIPKSTLYWADPTCGEEIEVFRRAGHRIRKAKIRSRVVGIDAVYRRLARGSITIHPKCENIIQESREYRYPNEEDEIIGGDPEGPHHALDCLRYLISMHDRFRNAKEREQWRENLRRRAA